MAMRPDDVLSSLAGSWFLDRSISLGASMIGTATVAAQGPGRFHYCEQGRLTLAGGDIIDAERRYIFAPSPGGFAVLFMERPPRLFHRIVLQRTGPNLAGSGLHSCIEDRYESRYEFRPDGSFVVRHIALGPRKRYTIATRYSRIPF
jgi:hypothetical protein